MAKSVTAGNSLRRLFAVMLFDHISVNITFPVLTFVFFSPLSRLFPSDTSISERMLWYGIVMGISHIGSIISSPIISTCSDHVGRKKMLLVAACAALVFAVSCTLGILIGSLLLMVLGKFLGGMLSRTNAVAQAIIGDISDPQNKAIHMGYLQVVISIGAFIGPIIGGYFADRFWFSTLNYALPYMIAGMFAVLAILLTIVVFKETLVTRKKVKESLSSWLINLSNKQILKISLLLCMTQLGWSTYYQYMPPLLKTTFHFQAHLLGLFIGMIALWLAIASAVGVRFLKCYFTLEKIAFIAIILMLLGALLTLAAIWLLNTVFAKILIWLGAIPMAMGDVIVYSVITAWYSNAVAKQDQGSIMGLCFIIVPVIWALTGFLGGVIAIWQIDLPLYFSALILLGLVCYLVAQKVAKSLLIVKQ